MGYGQVNVGGKGLSGGRCTRFLLATLDKQEVIPNAPKLVNIQSTPFYNGTIGKVTKGYYVEWAYTCKIKAEFDEPVKAVGVTSKVESDSGDRWTKSVELQYSDDGENYTSIGKETFDRASSILRNTIFNSQGKHKYWQIILQSYNSNWQGSLCDLIVDL